MKMQRCSITAGNKRRRASVVAAALCAALIAGCGGGGDDQAAVSNAAQGESPVSDADAANAADQPTAAGSADEPTAAPPATTAPAGGDSLASIGPMNPWGGDFAAEGEPVRGGTLVIGATGDPLGMDPLRGAGTAAAAIYEALMDIDPETGAPVPFLAESFESDDAVTWTLRLRADVRFHDGTPLDAEAVKANLELHISTETSPAHAHTIGIESMTAVDDLTLEIKLKEADEFFSTYFVTNGGGQSLGYINSPTARAASSDAGTFVPVGAGPFKFVEFTPGQRTVLERNDDYWVPGRPYLDRIEIRPLTDPESRFQALMSGDVDIIDDFYHPTLVRALDAGNLDVYYLPSGAEYIIFNFDEPPFNDRRMREAVIRAINPDALSQINFSGQMAPAHTLLSSFENGYTDVENVWPTYDPEMARELVAEYESEGNSASFSLQTTTAPIRRQFAEFIQAQMAEIGVDVELGFTDLIAYMADVVYGGQFQAATWTTPWYPTDMYIRRHYSSAGSDNQGNYSNPEVDELLEEAARTSDLDERGELYSQVERIVTEDLVRCYYSRAYYTQVARPEVNGLRRLATGEKYYADLWLEQ